VRPTLYRDNGGIEVLSVESGVVLMAFTGHCAGCPYALNTLNNVVSKTLKKYLPQIRAVQIKE
jgi:Fe-S cluster biogenesis protein NfuA